MDENRHPQTMSLAYVVLYVQNRRT